MPPVALIKYYFMIKKILADFILLLTMLASVGIAIG